jgi:hypothetical protein
MYVCAEGPSLVSSSRPSLKDSERKAIQLGNKGTLKKQSLVGSQKKNGSKTKSGDEAAGALYRGQSRSAGGSFGANDGDINQEIGIIIDNPLNASQLLTGPLDKSIPNK